MPVDTSSGGLSSALSSLGALGNLANVGGVSANPTDKFETLLESRTIADNVIKKHHLMTVLFADRWDTEHATWKTATSWFGWKKLQAPTLYEANRKLRKMTKIKVDAKSGLLSIIVEAKKPQEAADIANAFVMELDASLAGNTFSSEKRNRDFLEGQVRDVKNELASLELNLKNFQESHKLISLDAQTEASVQAYASLKSQLTAKEMELSLQEKSVSPDDVGLLGLKQEVAQLKQKLSTIDNGSSGGLLSFKDAPQLGMRFAQLKRDLMVKQQVFELLTQQLELAKVSEARDSLSFQVVDQAIAPDRKSKPNRLFNILAATLGSFWLGLLLVRVRAALSQRMES
jgi:uncharacterized protein involved in exopolysaccharide biosynthesis